MTSIEYYLAGDPAKQHDYFGIVLLERIGNTIKLVALKELQLDYNIVANYVESLHKKYHLRKMFLDQTGMGNVFIDMLKAKNLSVEGITLSNPKKVEIIETVIRLMQESRITLPKKGAKELKRQLQEQERDLTQSGMIRFTHPSNMHDDLFWAFCIGVYGIQRIMHSGNKHTIIVTKNWNSPRSYIAGTDYADEPFFHKPGITVTDVAIHIPE